jgi:hypothetical protein
VKIFNLSKKTLVSYNAKQLNSLVSSAIGLIGEKSPKAVVLRTSFGIHTFGVRFPLDILILDKDMVVRKSQENLKRNRFFFWDPRFNLVIELPSGTINKTRTTVGDKIEFQNEL